MSKPFNYKAYSIATLRRASYRTPMRNQALTNARISRGLYNCKICLDKGLKIAHPRKGVQVDHIDPAVRLSGWDNLDDFAERLFCPVEGLQVLCKPHHAEKTKQESDKRKILRKAIKAAKATHAISN